MATTTIAFTGNAQDYLQHMIDGDEGYQVEAFSNLSGEAASRDTFDVESLHDRAQENKMYRCSSRVPAV